MSNQSYIVVADRDDSSIADMSWRSLRRDAVKWYREWRDNFRERASLYARALHRTLVPYPSNNDFRKLTTTGLVTVWGAITLGTAFGYANPDPLTYGMMSAIVYTILGIQWGFQIQFLDNINVSTGGENDD